MKWLLLGLTVFLASCASVSKIGPGDVAVNEKMVARLGSAWNRIDVPGKGKIEMWTADGLPLDSLMFYPAIGDGEVLVEMQGRKAKQQPRFHATMQPIEIVELFDAVIAGEGSNFKLDKLSPVTFAGGNGFRFDFSILRKGDEVELGGAGYGVVKLGKLYLMVFRAPKIHYFGKHIGNVESIASSIQIHN
ncbi:MAG: hypothetical protein EPN14_04975 [Gallionella sp.]|nr:MAG: hypothetical protein EPN14_04975 [Gallionella sp.]